MLERGKEALQGRGGTAAPLAGYHLCSSFSWQRMAEGISRGPEPVLEASLRWRHRRDPLEKPKSSQTCQVPQCSSQEPPFAAQTRNKLGDRLISAAHETTALETTRTGHGLTGEWFPRDHRD